MMVLFVGLLFVDGCRLLVACCLSFNVCCVLLFIVRLSLMRFVVRRCLLFVICCVFCDVYGVLFVRSLLAVVCRCFLLVFDSCVLSLVCVLFSVVCRRVLLCEDVVFVDVCRFSVVVLVAYWVLMSLFGLCCLFCVVCCLFVVGWWLSIVRCVLCVCCVCCCVLLLSNLVVC